MSIEAVFMFKYQDACRLEGETYAAMRGALVSWAVRKRLGKQRDRILIVERWRRRRSDE